MDLERCVDDAHPLGALVEIEFEERWTRSLLTALPHRAADQVEMRFGKRWTWSFTPSSSVTFAPPSRNAIRKEMDLEQIDDFSASPPQYP